MDFDSDETIIIDSDDGHDEQMDVEIINEVIVTTQSSDNTSNNAINQLQLEPQGDAGVEFPLRSGLIVLDERSRSSFSSQHSVISRDEADQLSENEETCETEVSPSKKRCYEKCNDVDDDDGKTCPICFDGWTNLGEHRVCALRCGHVFGASCIIRWISLQKNCPTCKSKTSKREIRYIYAKKLIAMDVSELESIKAQLGEVTQEKNRIQIELTKAVCKEHMMVQQIVDLKKRIESLSSLEKPRVKVESSSGPSNLDKISLYMDKSLEICKEGGCRVLDYCSNLGLIVASMQSPNNLFRGFGVRKIDVATYKPTAFIPLHTLSIRDVSFHPENPWLLSVSLDKTIKVVDMHTCTVSVYSNVDFPLWSCCWDVNNTNMFFVGKRQGSIAKYDVRQMAEPVSLLEVPGDMSPVVSMASIAANRNCVIPAGGVISCKLNSLWVFENSETTLNEYNHYPLPIEGPFISMVLQDRQLLVSTRSNPRYPNSRHHLCNMETGTSNNLLCNTLHCFTGSPTQKFLSRSCLVSNNSNTYVAAHQEVDKSVLLWNTKTGQKSAMLRAHDPVLDLCGVNTNNGDLLAALTERKLEIFKFA